MIKLSNNTTTCGKCMHLLKEYGVCNHPDLKGNAVRLKRRGAGFVRRQDCAGPVKKPGKKSKYNNKKVTVNGVTYDSQDEYERFCELRLMEQAGIINKLKYHERFVLIDKSKYGREIAYEPDFVYEMADSGEKIVEDFKSKPTKTRLYNLKKRLMAERYGIIIQESMKNKPNKKKKGT